MRDEHLRYEQYHNRRMQKAHDDINRLERERDEALADARNLRDLAASASRRVSEVAAERDKARVELEELRGLAGDCFGRNSELLAERDTAKAQRDALHETLKTCAVPLLLFVKGLPAEMFDEEADARIMSISHEIEKALVEYNAS